MKKIRKSQMFLAGAATAVAVSSIVPITANAATATGQFFPDVDASHVLYNEIYDLYTKGAINGFEDGTFRPNESITRGQVAKIIASFLKLDLNNVKDPGFTDLQKDQWYYSSVAALAQAGILKGYDDKTVRPEQTITRAEAASLISRAFKLTGNPDTKVTFKDVDKDQWYYADVQTLVSNHVAKGHSPENFAPEANVTRAEFAAFTSRADNVQEPTYPIQSIQDGTVTIDGQSYQIADSLKGLFNSKNQQALKNAQISFESKDGVINKVKMLVLKNSGTSNSNLLFDAEGATIDGSLVVEGDYYELKNLIINEDLTISDSVKNSFISEKLTVKGNTRVSGEEKVSVASQYRAAAENPKTKITIIFKDSTMATIEIAKNDVYFEATGTTSVTSISLQANANITADPDVIIPKVDIKKGVTLVELNVTIKDIIIESNDDIKLTGKGNIENVVINTDKNVTLDTKGKIENLESKSETSKVTVGKEASITNIQVPEGKSAKDVVENFDQAKDQIEKVDGTTNPDYTPSQPSYWWKQ